MELNSCEPVEKVPLIGPLKGRKLERLGIKTVDDLLHHYPFRYDDFRNVKKISGLALGETVTVSGTVEKIENIYTRNRKNIIKAVISDDTGRIDVVWFNQSFLVRTLKPGTIINLAGKVDIFNSHLAFVSPEFEVLKDLSITNYKLSIHTGRLTPIYPETYGLSSKWLRSRINFLLNGRFEIEETLPAEILKENRLLGLKEALRKIHFPETLEEIDEAKKRLEFDEVFLLILLARRQRQRWNANQPTFWLKFAAVEPQLSAFLRGLPFTLTADQNRVLKEILVDLGQRKPMNRLLQGEVGSGKTVVAAAVSLATVLSGYKVLYMAPTEILASQHYQTFKQLLGPFGIETSLITASTRKNTKFQILNSKFQIVVGTHALLYQIKQIEKVGLIIIDEQHKFGVEQRAALLNLAAEREGKLPHLLTMTATPIPRTLRLTTLGDLDMSIIETLPKERKPIKTWLVPQNKREAAYAWIRNQVIDEGAQVYIICPFIDESENETLKSVRAAKKEFGHLKNIFKPVALGLLHGKMKSDEKEEIMNRFRAGKIKILVSTPVVEVGVDNPRATIILVEGAERFGLASLHQLRGRVGRGEKQSYCLLFATNDSPQVLNRLKPLEKINHGLKLAEQDLRNRGGGTIFGPKQSGFFKTKIADLSDVELVNRAGRAVSEFLLKFSRSDYEKRLLAQSNLEVQKIHTD